jgi:dihydropteroate synthase
VSTSGITWDVGPGRRLEIEPPVLMGIVNVTPDSFSDGGAFLDPSRAVEHALRLVDEGAGIIDIGGESTRPGAARIPASEQIDRACPVIEALRARSDVLISIDTTRRDVVAAAFDAGATIVNDVAAGTEDPTLFDVVAARGGAIVLMHRLRAPDEDHYSDRYESPPAYTNVVDEVAAFLRERAEAAVAAGIRPGAIAVDPGFGFGKTVEQNFALLAGLGAIVEDGRPVVCGVSRKSFVGAVAGIEDPARRLPGSLAAALGCARAGAAVLRVHDVAAHRQAIAVARALSR